MKPVKVYLDQKDFSRIGRGINGDAAYLEDLKIYTYLLQLVNDGVIEIYFSQIHVIEALRYKEQNSLLESYCLAVDSLTKGRCIRNFPDILKLEIEIFLVKEFAIDTVVNATPFSNGLNALFSGINLFDGFAVNLRKDVELQLNAQVVNKQQRLLLDKILKNKSMIKSCFLPFSQQIAAKLQNEFPGIVIKSDEIIELFCGNISIEKKLSARAWDHLNTFKNLILYYSKKEDYDLKKMGGHYDSLAERLCCEILKLQKIREVVPEKFKPKFDGNIKLLNPVFTNYFNDMQPEIDSLCSKYNLNSTIAKKKLTDNWESSIHSLNSFKVFSLEYVKANRGQRQPIASDFRDLLHLINLPYVDIYSTDNFFAQVIRNRAKNFNTIIIKSMSQLKDIINSKLAVSSN